MFIKIYLAVSCLGLSQASIWSRFCPPDFQPVDAYCFMLSRLSPMISPVMNEEDQEQPLCRDKDARIFEVKNWGDQEAAEQFLRGVGETGMVWLHGFVGVTDFRYTTSSFVWSTDFHPKVLNFIKEDPSLSGEGKCVVMDPREFYRWRRQPCHEKHKALCMKRRERYDWRHLKAIKHKLPKSHPEYKNLKTVDIVLG